jgi:hypothetical protein
MERSIRQVQLLGQDDERLAATVRVLRLVEQGDGTWKTEWLHTHKYSGGSPVVVAVYPAKSWPVDGLPLVSKI